MRYLLILFLLTSCSADLSSPESLNYPESKRESTNYNLHGTTVIDPYFYMEDFESPYVVEWSNQQNAFVESYLEGSEISTIQNILSEAYSSEYFSMSYFNPESEYYFYNSGSEQHHLYMKKGADDAVILDPNLWSDDQTLNLDKVSVSPNKKYLAYSVSNGGVDWRTIKIMDLETNNNLELEITEVKFSDINWKSDSSGVYYNKYPKPIQENRLSQQSYDAAIYFTNISTGNEELFYGKVNPEQNYTVSFIGEDKNILIKVVTGSEEENFYLYGNSIQALQPITPINEASFNYVHADNEGLFFITNLEANNYRLVKVSFSDFQMTEVIAEQDFALKGASFVKDYLIADYIDQADISSEIKFFDHSGDKLDLQLPNSLKGTIGGFQSMADNSIMFSVHSYTRPIQYFTYNLTEDLLELVWEEKIPGFNPDDYVEISTHYESKDGTMVPITYSHKSSIKLDKNTPIFLYAYGGYNISIRPAFTPKYVAWLEMGGVLAVANIRGGGEFGKAWHNAGRLDTKQNVFDDFLYASKFLENNSIGNRKSTVISGRSNGGLLVGTTLVQNPNYFGAALPAVGVMDMIRFTEFTEGWGWRGDYGSPILNQTDFQRNIKISPYHQTKIDVCYSPTLTTTGRRDDRVVPSHSYKFTARLQEYQGCTNPVMLYDATRAGHGSGNGVAMPKWKRIELFSIEQSFALKNIKQ